MKYKCAVCKYEVEVENPKDIVDKCGWMFFFHHAICFVCKQKTWIDAFEDAKRPRFSKENVDMRKALIRVMERRYYVKRK
jgi:hypothetical protein